MELRPEQSIWLVTVHTHPDTGLVIGSSEEDEYVIAPWLHGGLGVPKFVKSRTAFFKDAFVVGITPDGLTRYYVKDPSDILKLLKIVNENVSEAFIGVTTDAVEEMMGGGVG